MKLALYLRVTVVMQLQRDVIDIIVQFEVGGLVLQLYRSLYAVRSAFSATATLLDIVAITLSTANQLSYFLARIGT